MSSPMPAALSPRARTTFQTGHSQSSGRLAPVYGSPTRVQVRANLAQVACSDSEDS